jgi:hypothetical protein
MLVFGLMEGRLGSLWWQVLGGESQVLARDLNWQPMAAMASDGRRLVVMFSRRDGKTIRRLSIRVWDFDPAGKLTERTYDAARSYDASVLTERFPRETRLWAHSSDLRMLAIPTGDRISVVDVERNEVLTTATLGIPLAVGPGYLLLSQPSGSFDVWPVQQPR